MGTLTPLCDSNFCRLCAEENPSGSFLFGPDSGEPTLDSLINKYLPLKVEDNGKLPRTICPGCHIQVQATVQFFTLLVHGQKKLRDMWKEQVDREKRESRKKEMLAGPDPVTLPEGVVVLLGTEDGEFTEIAVDRALFPDHHELALQVEGLERPRRKRGRPPKKKPEEEELLKQEMEPPVEEARALEEPVEEPEEIGPDGRKRRRRRVPLRYSEAVQGKELEKILKDEGIIDESEIAEEPEMKTDMSGDIVHQFEDTIVIGHMENKEGYDIGQLVVVNKNKSRTRQRSRKKKVKFACDVCGKGFMHKGRYMMHRTVHRGVLFECSTCNERFPERIVLEVHQKSTEHTGEGIVEGVVSEQKEESADEPDRLKDLESRFPCDQCDKSFQTKQSHELHVRAIHQGEKPFSCDICGKQFSYHNSLKGHITSHMESKGERTEFGCDICGKKFTHPSSVVYHKDSEHNDGRRFICNRCGKGFKHKQLLQRHQLVHSEKRPYPCKSCHSRFKTKANLLNHQQTHTGEKRYFCDLCGQQFAHKTSLTLHYRWHSGDKPYVCNICGKRFSQNGNLQEHVRIHTGEKPFACSYCGRKFTTSSQYKLHLKRHTGEKPWQCEFCNKRFLHKDTWKCHTRRHRGERPYQCSYCNRGFTEQWALKKHVRLHTGEKPYACTSCGKTFADCSNLTKHRKVHREIKIPSGVMENAVLQLLQQQLPEGTEAHVETVSGGGGDVAEGGGVVGSDGVQQIIYVTYQDPDDPSEAKTIHLVEGSTGSTQEHPLSAEPSIISTEGESGTLSLGSIQLATNPPFHLMDEEGNPVHITTQDGHHIQITMSDGRTIQVTTPDGQNFCEEQATEKDAPTDLPMPEDGNRDLPSTDDSHVALENTPQVGADAEPLEEQQQTIEFTTRDGQHVRVVTPYKLEALQFAAEFLGSVG